ncbi:IS1403 transposase, IS3 family protein [Xanthomonas fragariae LMG 25863]|nr:IS1403 transposase, IS3 family protein [Xanthomonas fragariae LMG 25863]
MVSAPARRALVREWIGCGASERRALAAIGMSASALRYCPREDRNVELRERILALAHRHRRYGVGMIYLKLLKKLLAEQLFENDLIKDALRKKWCAGGLEAAPASVAPWRQSA